MVKSLVADPWMTNKPDGRQAERLATAWKWDEARTTLRLTLRRDVYFHDGTLLTPQIAAEVLRRSAKATEAFSFTSIKSVTPAGDDAIEIRTSEPNSFIVPDLSGVLVMKPGQKNVGTGPFQLAHQEDQDYILTAFPKYFRGRPALEQVEVRNYPRQRNAWAALMRGEIDVLHEVSREAAEFVEAETTVRVYTFPRPYYIPLVFNVRRPVFQRADVRQAINEAIDRTALVRDGMNNRGRPADGPIPPEHWAYSPAPQPFVFNPDAARLRLDQAGFKVNPSHNGSAPVRFAFTCLVFANDARFERLAALVQKQLADVGIDMRIEPVAQQNLEQRIGRGDFDAFLFEMAGRTLSWVYEFWRSHEGTRNNSGYTAADSVLEGLKAARSDDEVRSKVAELARVLHNNPPAAFLAWQQTSRAISTNFNVSAEPQRDVMTNAWQWRQAAKQGSK